MEATPQKIIFLLSSFRAAGGERVMIMLANNLASKGIPVDLIVLKKVGEYEFHLDPRINIIVFDVWRMIFALPKLVLYLRKIRPAAIVATDEYTHLLSLMARGISRVKTRVILRIGNMFSELYGRYSGMKRRATFFLMKRLYRNADALIANSKGVADDIIQLTGVDPSHVSVIFNPKPIEEIQKQGTQPTGLSWLDTKDLPVILGVGRLREQKNFSMLIHAFATVVASIPSRLVIVGGGREEDRLRSLVKELGLEDRVVLTGYQDNPYAYMAKADIFAFSSLWEGMPNSLMEAMVCGLPIVATDCPSGPRELLAPETDHQMRNKKDIEYARYGILVPMNDEHLLAEALQKLLKNEGVRGKYARASVDRAEVFEAEGILKEYARVLGVAE